MLKPESSLIAERFLAHGNWQVTQAEVLEQNLLQSRTASSAKRIVGELVKRLQRLNNAELQFLVDANYEEKGYLLWLAICRCYRFLGEFAVEVLHERFITLQITLNHEDYNYFFTHKAAYNEKLAKLSESTQYKLRQTTFKMLRDVELLSSENIITPAVLSKELAKLIAQGNPNEFFYYPIFEADVARLLQWKKTLPCCRYKKDTSTYLL